MANRKDTQPKETSGKETHPKKPGNRDIFLFGRLENAVALPVIQRLLKLDTRDADKPINLFINSSGGNGYNADAIIAVMNWIKAKVNTICLGHALSGACEILASGTGERSAYEFATLMFHQTLWEADGDITNLEIQAAQGQRFREAQVELLHRCTGQSKDRIRKDIERDHYMSADEARKYGIIDRVIDHSSSKTPKSKGSVEMNVAAKTLSKNGYKDKAVKPKVAQRSQTKSKSKR